ncbi:DNA/RNA helicases, SNF2 family [hydrothermal vent metagenome]|uniref:DNA/RNA helicases, SNF2 family n=1 Tax=hydrothermal vent metagenome TaxID=652676 RepID=A0A3B0V3S1_9ZZZZ
MTTDITFITNEENQTLKERFNVLIKYAHFFDVLVGYFYTSGFSAIYKALENSEKIRILIGISTNRQTYDLITHSQKAEQLELIFSHAEAKNAFAAQVETELAESEDNHSVERGVLKFIEWIRCGKLEIKVYPSQKIHAKLYIMTFHEDDRDDGRVITGSSNLTQSGLVDNLEFNVELKNPADYHFAKDKFEQLWADAADISEKYIETIQTKTWLNQAITPYHLYLKFLYEYFKDELSQSEEIFASYLPENFMKLEYQEQAVLNAKKILEEYGGVFVSDVVGLGKTYIATLLAGQLDGRTLVIAPPALIDKDNPGSWTNAFSDFRIAADHQSVGKLDSILRQGVEKYSNIIIDEAHRFRTETNITYEKLAEICRGKRIILVTATPYNNAPQDILSQLKLFQSERRSTIPNLPDLKTFFGSLQKNLKGLDRQQDREEYLRVVKQNARQIREKVLKYLMVRRTRTEIVKYFAQDLASQGLKFPEVANPKPFFYELNDQEDRIFNRTIELLSQAFTYARYTPLKPEYFRGKTDHATQLSQINMGKFMKILLVKRLESSFFAFKNSINRFIHSYELFIAEFEKGNLYISKKYIHKIFDLLENDDDETIERLVQEGKADRYSRDLFNDNFLDDLKSDLAILQRIKEMWAQVKRDPKLLTLLDRLATNPLLNQNKLIIFTESKETAEYLTQAINKAFPKQALGFSGGSSERTRQMVIQNFDAKARTQKDDYRILISTEVLSEGVNLHRANVVINYDIPWNPTRMMQRVGRINRVDTTFDTIYTFNFFPTRQANDELKLKEAAVAKISAFLTLLGGDAELLTEGEPIGSHELFDRLSSKESVVGEEEAVSELKYLTLIKAIRDNDPDLFATIKRLPRKSRSGKIEPTHAASLITYFRKGKVQKFFIAAPEEENAELDFLTAAELLESEEPEKKQQLPATFFELLDRNKAAFIEATTAELIAPPTRGGRDAMAQILKKLRITFKNRQPLTDTQEEYVNKVLARLADGSLPKQTAKTVNKALSTLTLAQISSPLYVVALLQVHVPAGLLASHYAEQNPRSKGKREVILSMYLAGD